MGVRISWLIIARKRLLAHIGRFGLHQRGLQLGSALGDTLLQHLIRLEQGEAFFLQQVLGLLAR